MAFKRAARLLGVSSFYQLNHCAQFFYQSFGAASVSDGFESDNAFFIYYELGRDPCHAERGDYAIIEVQ